MWIKRDLQDQLATMVRRAVEAAQDDGALVLHESNIDVQIEVPRDRAHGDFATNAALALAGAAGMPPRQLAQQIVERLPVEETDFLDGVEIAGPGFINFRLTIDWLHNVVRAALAPELRYGVTDYGNGQPVLLEFVSANPTGPLVVANARAAAVGDALCNILNAAGFEAASEYYVNDAGNQVLNLGKAMEARCWQQLGVDHDLPEEAYPGDYVVDIAKEYIGENGPDQTRRLLENGSDIHAALGYYAVEKILREQRHSLSRYGVEFDHWFSERSIREAGEPERVLELLSCRGYTYEKEGAVWLRTTEFGDDKDRVLIKSDGEYTYLVPDAAYHLDKFERGYDRLINLWGPDHHGYIPRMKAALQALGYGADQLEVLIVQWVRLLRDGQVVRMSKRGGDFITMDELLDEVGRDAARFFFLMRSPDTHMDFDLDLAKLETNENPVYYVQYAHARISSILREAEERGVGFAPKDRGRLDLSLLTHPKEEELMRCFAEFPSQIVAAAEGLEPQLITTYARELATAFHGFYTECRVLGEEAGLTQSRLALCQATQSILQTTLGLLGVSAPERM